MTVSQKSRERSPEFTRRNGEIIEATYFTRKDWRHRSHDRSYWCWCPKKYYRNTANRKVRQTKGIYNGGSYKKVYDLEWNID